MARILKLEKSRDKLLKKMQLYDEKKYGANN